MKPTHDRKILDPQVTEVWRSRRPFSCSACAAEVAWEAALLYKMGLGLAFVKRPGAKDEPRKNEVR